MTLQPLAEVLRETEPDVVQPWFADDSGMQGDVAAIERAMDLLLIHGPQRGYFLEPAKSIVVCRPADVDAIQDELGSIPGRFCWDRRVSTGLKPSIGLKEFGS